MRRGVMRWLNHGESWQYAEDKGVGEGVTSSMSFLQVRLNEEERKWRFGYGMVENGFKRVVKREREIYEG